MDRKILNMSTIGGLLTAILLVVADYRITAGIILGLAFFRLYYLLLTMNFDDLLEYSSDVKMRNLGSKTIRMLVLALPLIVSLVIPEVFNVWGVFAGLLAFKITLYLYSIVNK